MPQVLTGNVEQITKALEEGLERFMHTDAFRQYLRAVASFPTYSMRNQLLIAMQRPDASLVAGYNAWKKMKRQVRRGERGIRILAPVLTKVEVPGPEKDENGAPKNVEKVIPRFRAVSVFDVSQTDGEPLPKLEPKELDGDVPAFRRLREAMEKAAGVPVRYALIEGTARGYYDGKAGEIVIRQGMGEAQILKTLIHEAAHAMLHRPDQGKKDPKTREMEAESVAFTVCSHFGVDTSEYSFPYISGWAGKGDLTEWRESLETIRAAATELIGRIHEEERLAVRREEAPLVASMVRDLLRDLGAAGKGGIRSEEKALACTAELLSRGETRRVEDELASLMEAPSRTEQEAERILDVYRKVRELRAEDRDRTDKINGERRMER